MSCCFQAPQQWCWGTRPPSKSSDFVFQVFFFQSDRSTQYQETHSTLNGKKKWGGGGMAWNGKNGSAFKNIRIRVEGASRYILITQPHPQSLFVFQFGALRPCDEVSLNSGTSMAFFKEESVSRIIQWSTAENFKIFANSGCCYSSFRTDYGVFRNGLFSNKRQAPYNLSKAPNCYSV